MTEKILHAFEAGRRGKPDELETGIANLISAHFLTINPLSRFDVRVTGSYQDRPSIRVSGEITDTLLHEGLQTDLSRVISDQYNKIHKTTLAPQDFNFTFAFKPQAAPLAHNTAAGDSGTAIAVAYKHTPYHLPWERFLAVNIRDIIDAIYQQDGQVPAGLAADCGITHLQGLRADGKIAAHALYDGANLDSIRSLTIAVEHEPTLPVAELRDKLTVILRAHLSTLEKTFGADFHHPTIEINTLGDWNDGGGWQGDEGSREAKPYRDAFATYGVLEDSFSGEDPTKPSATGTFLARHIAVQLVNRFADFARVALIYTIGSDDVGVHVSTNNTATLPQHQLEEWVKQHIPLSIHDTITRFKLRDTDTYKQIVRASDYFHDPTLPWNTV
ncbi:methionine adenosyltransferase domain-containing protein [Candidatus Woesearchaeota archaeon]|nr:methionine adenosyltransferase domain-containing protein [Candidatus Woesearchaeota archaeon]